MLNTAVQQVNKSVPASLRFDDGHRTEGLFKRLKSPAPLQQKATEWRKIIAHGVNRGNRSK
jgi:hypothetical protein